jgi:zinc transporter, ZIP family
MIDAWIAVPIVFLLLGNALSFFYQPKGSFLSGFHHFTAGIVFAAVALELIPSLLLLNQKWWIVAGFSFGVASMLIVKEVLEHAAFILAIAVDLWVDGLLVAIGFSVGLQGGVILLLGLTLETFSLGVSLSSVLLNKKHWTKHRVFATCLGLGLVIAMGFFMGKGIMQVFAPGWIAFVLGFGVSALLYLVTEELLVEAHLLEDTPLATAMFFIGFLIPLWMSLNGH